MTATKQHLYKFFAVVVLWQLYSLGGEYHALTSVAQYW